MNCLEPTEVYKEERESVASLEENEVGILNIGGLTAEIWKSNGDICIKPKGVSGAAVFCPPEVIDWHKVMVTLKSSEPLTIKDVRHGDWFVAPDSHQLNGRVFHCSRQSLIWYKRGTVSPGVVQKHTFSPNYLLTLVKPTFRVKPVVGKGDRLVKLSELKRKIFDALGYRWVREGPNKEFYDVVSITSEQTLRTDMPKDALVKPVSNIQRPKRSNVGTVYTNLHDSFIMIDEGDLCKVMFADGTPGRIHEGSQCVSKHGNDTRLPLHTFSHGKIDGYSLEEIESVER